MTRYVVRGDVVGAWLTLPSSLRQKDTISTCDTPKDICSSHLYILTSILPIRISLITPLDAA